MADYLEILTGFSLNANRPLDKNTIKTKAEMLADSYGFNGKYCFCADCGDDDYGKLFVFNSTEELSTETGYYHKYEGQIIQVKELPTACAALLGVIYQYIGATTTGSYQWTEQSYTSGDETTIPTTGYYKCTNSTTAIVTWYLNGEDITGMIHEEATLPEPSAAHIDKLYLNTTNNKLYLCTKTDGITNGFFYKCISDTTVTPVTYSWSNIKVQESKDFEFVKKGEVLSDDDTHLATSGRLLEMMTNLAPAFSESSTYALNKYCEYQGDLYRCITAITTAGAWDDAKWTKVTVAEEFLSVFGGTMKGIITFDNSSENKTVIKGSSDDYGVNIFAGTSNTDGALIGLRGKDNSSAGEFWMQANDGTNSYELHGKPDGTLTWTGDIITGSNKIIGNDLSLSASDGTNTNTMTLSSIGTLNLGDKNRQRFGYYSTDKTMTKDTLFGLCQNSGSLQIARVDFAVGEGPVDSRPYRITVGRQNNTTGSIWAVDISNGKKWYILYSSSTWGSWQYVRSIRDWTLLTISYETGYTANALSKCYYNESMIVLAICDLTVNTSTATTDDPITVILPKGVVPYTSQFRGSWSNRTATGTSIRSGCVWSRATYDSSTEQYTMTYALNNFRALYVSGAPVSFQIMTPILSIS